MAQTAAESLARSAGQDFRVTGRNRGCAMADVNLLPPQLAKRLSFCPVTVCTHRALPNQWTVRSIAWTLWQGWWLAIWLASLWVWLAVLEGMAW